MQKAHQPLSDRIILVAGNASHLSQGIIKPFLQAGATVIAPAISLQDIRNLENYVARITTGRLITQLLDVPDFDQIAAFTETIREKFGRLDLAVATIDSTVNSEGLSEVELEDWQEMLEQDINLFFTCARITLPLLKQTPNALFVSACLGSYPESAEPESLATLADTIRTSMARLFALEARQHHTRYYYLRVPRPLTDKAGLIAGQPSLLPNYDLVGEYIIQLYSEPTTKERNVFPSIALC
ncbi:MAG: hypothetical protein AVDCRST_MAG95-507 [uncultured Adhaeribacter sp.]|uniref:Uncharacterized protein n=1 Tax=uncultured Adhaeribacter sp. TaxID=448109 RepID=A0A6J4HFZ1_9BACT|nr:MAG: hypothetical protein AVDCRST_MAG95-507 [uncultured Adhaeribacter sp.]